MNNLILLEPCYFARSECWVSQAGHQGQSRETKPMVWVKNTEVDHKEGFEEEWIRIGKASQRAKHVASSWKRLKLRSETCGREHKKQTENILQCVS